MTLKALENPPSLTERAYEVLREAILSLELKPGQDLSVQALAEQLGVSRTPIMTALRRLEGDGLVRGGFEGRGVRVTTLTRQDMLEIVEARSVLESYVAKKAAESLSTEQLEEAERIVDRQEELWTQGENLKARHLGYGLHDLLLDQANNGRLRSFVRQLDIEYTRIRNRLATLADFRWQSIEGHRRIVEALKARDGKAASAAMSDHLGAVQYAVIRLEPLEDRDGSSRNLGP
jgi:DNA-binding GntR family transcriptional regulator